MFRRLISFGQQNVRVNLFGAKINCRLHEDHKDNIVLGPGGGLEKLQGSIKEEIYFNDQNSELLAKIRADGAKNLKCENCGVGNWTEFEKVLHASTESTALRGTCSQNKYKNCLEEAYFLTEQSEILKQLRDKHSENHKANEGNEDNNVAHE